jgi:hypothetical protein
MTRPLFRFLAAAAAAAVLSLAGLPASGQPARAVQSTTVAGVTVKVSPKNLAADAQVWELAVVLDTHSQDLSDDLARTAVLVTDDGRELAPAAWTGAGPGGHHREGVLQFAVPQPAPRAIELRIQRPGESAPRSFRWDL